MIVYTLSFDAENEEESCEEESIPSKNILNNIKALK